MATIQGTAGNDSLTGTQGDDSISGLAGSDTINALGGNDTLDGGAGIDTLIGGLGNDRYIATAGDVLSDTGGTDTVVTDANWTLGADFENLEMTGTGNLSVTGHNGNNFVIGNSGSNYFNLRAGDDTIQAGAGNDWIDMSAFGTSTYGDDVIDGGAGTDTVNFAISAGQQSAITVDLTAGTIRGGGQGGTGSVNVTNVERVIGAAFNDSIKGSAGSETLEGREGNDTLSGMGGNDSLTGGTGQDTFLFAAAPGAGNVDQVVDFASATDKLAFDNTVFTAIGGSGNFVAGDARFAAGAGFTSGRDASDRIVYDTTTGQLFYDADGNGTGAAQLIATLQGAPSLAATDVAVVGQSQPGPVQGTAGNDSLVGTNGNDSINGLGGNDTLQGLGGDDLLIGGDGADSLVGGPGADTLTGGAGDDIYVAPSGDLIEESGGIDTIMTDVSWTLFDTSSAQSAVENLTLTGSALSGVGNRYDNVITGNDGANFLNGRVGNDTVLAGGGNDTIGMMMADFSLTGDDVIDGGDGVDLIDYSGFAQSRINVNLATGTSRGGSFDDLNSATLFNVENVFANEHDDRLTGSSAANLLNGRAGNDIIDGGGGNDRLTGEAGSDNFVFSAAPGAANADQITDFTSGSDKIRLDPAVMSNLGAEGNFASGDARFFAASGAVAGHDADDRVIYNTSSGQLFYDADGSGAGAAQLIATLRGDVIPFPPAEAGAPLSATDIVVGNFASGPLITGTAGDDSLVGGTGNDTLRGLGGNDTLDGASGNDVLDGGNGNDLLDGGAGFDTLDGGAGNDTLDGGIGGSVFAFSVAPGAANADVIASFSSSGDRIQLDAAVFANIGVGGNLKRDDERFHVGTAAHDETDRVIYDTSTKNLYYDADGTGPGAMQRIATLQSSFDFGLAAQDVYIINGGPDLLLQGTHNNESLTGGDGNDSIYGGAGSDTLSGGAGNDQLDGEFGQDVLTGGTGADEFFLSEAGEPVADRITDFASGSDKIRLDGSTFVSTGPSGNFSSGDARFLAAPGASSGRDASDRVVYDTSTGNLWYDQDGSGASAPQLLATVPVGTAIAASDFAIDNGSVDTSQQGGPGNDSLVGGNGNDSLSGAAGNDTLSGGGGNDLLDGGTGNDTVDGGGGDDTLDGGDGDDTLDGGVGVDLVRAGSGNDTLINRFGDDPGTDTLDGGVGDDTYDLRSASFASTSTELLDAGGADTVLTNDDFVLPAGIENLTLFEGTRGVGNELDNVIITRSNESRGYSVDGGAGNDTLIGGADPVGMTGGSGNDVFVFTGSDGRSDTVRDFVSGTDRLHFDNRGFTTLGATGDLVPGDGRFAAGAGLTSARDADDRIIYDTSSGLVFYDADGAGGVQSIPVILMSGAPALAASDITVIGRPPVQGTAGNDSLTGTEGNDALAGLAGSDTINALGGDDTLDGGAGIDTLNGGLGNDAYIVDTGDVLSDAGGIDTVVTGVSWTLGADFENLTMTGTGNLSATGNNGANVAIGNSGNNYFNLRAGNDNIQAGAGNDWIDMSAFGTASYGSDFIDGGTGIDTVNFDISAGQQSAITVDLRVSSIRGGGQAGAGEAGVTGIERVIGAGFNDSFTGEDVAETFEGRAGNDTLSGMGGNDTLVGGTGADSFVFAAAPGTGNVDLVSDFVSGNDKAAFDNAVFTALGADGNFAAGDARFAAGTGFTSGRDASDRIVYNTSTGQLFYDADGSGAGVAQLVATFQGNPAITATDITVL